jgi:CHAT domain-containing protein
MELMTGQAEKARRHYLEALRMKEEAGTVGRGLATVYNGLCRVELDAQRLAEAERYCVRLQELHDDFAPLSLGAAQAWHNLSELARVRGRRAEAETLAKRAWARAMTAVGGLADDDARYGAGREIRKFGGALVRLQTARGADAEALITIEQMKTQALEALLLQGRALRASVGEARWAEHQTVLAAFHAADVQLDGAVRDQQTAAQALKELGPSASPESLARLKAEAARTAAARLEAHAAYTRAHTNATTFWNGIRRALPNVAPTPPTLEQLRRTLAPGTVAVTFMSDEFAIAAVAISADQPLVQSEWIVSPSETAAEAIRKLKELLALIDDYQALLDNSDSRLQDVTLLAERLYRRLFPGKIAVLVKAARRLVLSPDGMVWHVPFAALVESGTRNAPRYLGDRVPITYTQSLTVLQQSLRRGRESTPRARPNVLAVGVSDFSRRGTVTSRAASLPSLPHARAEATAVAGLYGVAPRLNAQATEGAVRRALEDADIVHFATHGRLDESNVMSSAVILSAGGGSGQSDDGVFEAWEIFAHVRLRAELVVLSACETARGGVSPEGIVGLTRSLQYAGAASVVASQWAVNDASTRRLMEAFHRELQSGKRKDEALMSAAAMLRSNPSTSHPYYWAPFILLGSPENPWARR